MTDMSDIHASLFRDQGQKELIETQELSLKLARDSVIDSHNFMLPSQGCTHC